MRLTMRKAVALLLGILVPVLGLAGAGLAQSAVSVQGVIQAVDCQTGSLVLQGAAGSNTISVNAATAVLVNSTSVPFCVLQQYVGTSATAWLIPSGNELQVTRVDVAAPAAAAVAPTVSAPSPLGLFLGALAVGALGYVIGRSSAPSQPVYQPYAPRPQQRYYYQGQWCQSPSCGTQDGGHVPH